MMKKILLSVFAISFCIGISAQSLNPGDNNVFLDASSGGHSNLDFYGGGSIEIADNPDAGAGYSAAKVFHLKKGHGNPWPGTQTHTGGYFIYNGSPDTVWTCWYYAKYPQQVMLTNQEDPNWFTRAIAYADYTEGEKWQKLVFKLDTTGTKGAGIWPKEDSLSTWTINPFHNVTIKDENSDSLDYWIDSLATTIGWKPIDKVDVNFSAKDLAGVGGKYTVKLLHDGGKEIELKDDDKDNLYTATGSYVPYYYTDGSTVTALQYEFSRDGVVIDTVTENPWGRVLPLIPNVSYVGRTDPATDIYLTETPPTIDGEMGSDELWKDLAANFMVNQVQNGNPVTAYWKAAWDLDYIYVGVQVEDANLHATGKCYNDDNQELYFNMSNASHPVPYTSGEDGNWQLRYIYNASTLNTGSKCDEITTLKNSKYAQSHKDGVSFYEWKMKWTDLSSTFSASPGKTIGFDCAYGDDPDGSGRQAVMTWNYSEDEAYQDVSVFGKITLKINASSVAQNKLANVKVTPNPATNTLYISNALNVKEISVHNILGAKVKVLTSISDVNTIDLRSFESGLYFVSLKGTDGSKRTVKVLVK